MSRVQNTAAIDNSLETERRQFISGAKTGRDSELKVYVLLSLLFVCGYLWRDSILITPEIGLGYWLGIVGATLMLTLLLYPLRKRLPWLSFLGSTKAWFQVHMLFGLIGPLLILYHSNFQLGSINSQVALYSTLLVSASGIVGRHFYSRIHRGLYGRKTSLNELQADLAKVIEDDQGLTVFSPQLVKKLEQISAEMQEKDYTEALGIRRSIKWTLTHRFTELSLKRMVRREHLDATKQSQSISRNHSHLLSASNKYISDYIRMVGRVAQFTFYERLFSLWHVLHLPIFFLLIVSALFHVIAVHMY